MRRLKINIVDDHVLITDGLQVILGNHKQIEINNVAHTGEIALAQLVHSKPDIVLLDYSLSSDDNPETLNGLQTAEHILDRYPAIRILMLTMHDADNIILPCIRMGVHGYMLKSERNMDVASAILQLYNLGYYFSPSIAKDISEDFPRHRQDTFTLSTREQEVLDALFKGANTREIGDTLGISIHTVETHRKHLIHKFEARNSIHLIYLALQKGFLKV